MFKIQKSILLPALKLLALSHEARAVIPLLSTVLIKPSKGQIQLSSTDFDMRQDMTLECTGDVSDLPKAGICINLVRLRKAAELADSEICFTVDDEAVSLQCGFVSITLPVSSGDDFPDIKLKGKAKTLFTLAPSAFCDIIAKLTHCVSTEETHFYLNGIFCHAVDGQLKLVATDGHRLAKYEAGEADSFDGVILPHTAIKVITQGLQKSDLNGIDLSFDGETRCRIKFAKGHTLTFKVIDYNYPDYQRVIPSKGWAPIRLDCSDMTRALRAANIVYARNERPSVAIEAKGTAIHMSADRYDGGGSFKAAVSYEGKAFKGKYGVRASYLQDALKVLPRGDVSISFKDAQDTASAPCIITHPELAALTQVLMPLRLN